MIRVTVAGVTGWVGKPLAQAIHDAPDLQLVAAAARRSGGSNRKEAPKIEVTMKKPRHAARLFGFQRSEGLFAECCPRRLKSRSLTSSELEHA